MDVNLPRRLQKARESRDMTQTELARRIEKSRSAICEWEKGLREPSLADLRAIAKVLDVELAELVA
jgi:transcriptional regulator with XRE-family HTH domain